MAVRRAVGNLKGVGGVDADPGTKKVVVSFDPSVTNAAAIESAMADVGFPVAK